MNKEEAMKTLKDFHDKSALFSVRTALHTIIPELRESEDEKIRKELIKHLKDGAEGYMPAGDSEDYARWLAWVEKQDEKKSQRMVSAEAKEALYDKPTDEEMKELLRTEYEKGRADTIAEMKSSWSEEDINKPNGGIVMEDFNDGNGFYKVNLAYLNKEQVEEIEELVKRWNLQPKLDRDESIISDLLDYFDEDKCLKHEVVDIIEWLKAIKSQPKQEWSEEDEEIINSITGYLCTHDSCELDGFNKWYDFLKSLKERCTWKPSEEQLECLHDAINHYHTNGYPASKLNELYEQMSKIYKL